MGKAPVSSMTALTQSPTYLWKDDSSLGGVKASLRAFQWGDRTEEKLHGRPARLLFLRSVFDTVGP